MIRKRGKKATADMSRLSGGEGVTRWRKKEETRKEGIAIPSKNLRKRSKREGNKAGTLRGGAVDSEEGKREVEEGGTHAPEKAP